MTKIFSPYEEQTFIPEKNLYIQILFQALADLLVDNINRDSAVAWFRYRGSLIPRAISYDDVCAALDIGDYIKRGLQDTVSDILNGRNVKLSVKKRYRVLGDYLIKGAIK